MANWLPGISLVVAVLAVPIAYFAGRGHAESSPERPTMWNLPAIDATASATSEKFSIATGLVSEEAEGLFVLDHNSGLLQCNVIYPRLGQFKASFQANVAEALSGGGKGGQYIMVTGQADFPRSSTNPAASCVVYVLDSSTGEYAVYGVPFNRVLVNNNRSQQGPLVLLHKASANPLIDRDSLR